jgi:hypothetical protein
VSERVWRRTSEREVLALHDVHQEDYSAEKLLRAFVEVELGELEMGRPLCLH